MGRSKGGFGGAIVMSKGGPQGSRRGSSVETIRRVLVEKSVCRRRLRLLLRSVTPVGSRPLDRSDSEGVAALPPRREVSPARPREKGSVLQRESALTTIFA